MNTMEMSTIVDYYCEIHILGMKLRNFDESYRFVSGDERNDIRSAYRHLREVDVTPSDARSFMRRFLGAGSLRGDHYSPQLLDRVAAADAYVAIITAAECATVRMYAKEDASWTARQRYTTNARGEVGVHGCERGGVLLADPWRCDCRDDSVRESLERQDAHYRVADRTVDADS